MRVEVKIVQFKSGLSRYLRYVQQGNEVLIKDRDTPIARLVPCQRTAQPLRSKPPIGSLKDLDHMPVRVPRRLAPGDLDEALRKERRDRFADGAS